MEEKDQSSLEENIENELVLASRWSRLWASLLDALIILIIAMPIIYFTNGFDNIFKGTLSATYALFLVAIQIVVFIALNGKLLLNKGQTIGKMVLNIKIVTLTGELPSVKQHLIKRFGVYLLTSQIPFIGQFLSMINVLMIFGKKKRCAHDYFAGTMVVNC
ncbi:hypothetical protein [uncultured Gammaproteobacteria bacterium]|jgi:uncharacterized RDD family membrane protein YckC|nr:hypothetical protein [uncultured Gammaproteobacteria bacterium]CAC9561527.1 hypothetical protein [uncultured Gammaproteobacteria bacterium]CAC9565937.1 hypothetical protein [uncultured Gammaproteobacteria bacterium]CAC9566056.1 hypothetical protein [uncultured Gammaproteobacteria bacterium]CAC9996729.1 hypothetical protein [uncultured Gammaproteobacteria bacterium]